ncbi:MAG: HEAT repeat domain-containing protein [Acidobacteriia bacterium]|nr:HEAT repeat domain-containing protein [Terriglobia bacterium]
MPHERFKCSTSQAFLVLFCIIAQPLFGQEKTGATIAPTGEMQAIMEQLGSENVTTQMHALERLKGQKNKRPALPALHALLVAHRDDAPESVEQRAREINLLLAVQNLLSIGDASSLQPLQELGAREGNELSKVALAWGTAALGDPSGTEILLTRLRDTGAPNKFEAAKALRETAAQACKDLIERGRLQPVILLDVARQASKDFDSKNENKGKSLAELRAKAATLYGYELDAALSRARELSRLLTAYSDVWTKALLVLAVTEKGVPVLAAALRDPDPSLVDLRGTMVATLGESKDDRAVLPLIELLRDSSDQSLKSAAGKALQNITGQNIGEDAVAWTAWWKGKNKGRK